MSVIHAPRQANLDERQLFVPVLLGLALLFFLARLWYVQIVRAEALSAMGVSTTIDKVETLAPRGRIVDRNGALLAGVRQNAVVTAVYDIVEKHPEAVEEVARLLGITPERLKQPLKKWDPYVPSVVYVGVTPEVASYIAEAGDRLPGFGIEFQPTRIYTETTAYSHIMGYVWKPSEREEQRLKEMGIKPQTYVGRAGFEAQYEALLMGVPGAEHMAVNPQMKPLRTISTDRPVPGKELVMGLDVRLQRLAVELLGARRGAVVATDPRTGEVLCMVSSPTFDISVYDNGISTANNKLLMEDKGRPLVNRAIAGMYPPGSTFKIVTGIAAELAGVFDPSRRVTCNGGYRFGNRTWGCLGRHGSIAFHEAMTKSCNTYFCDMAMRAGNEKMREAFRLLGIDVEQGIDLPGEIAGTLPTEAYLERVNRTLQRGDILNTGIGQGYVSMTPLQMATVISAVANRGKTFKPHLLIGQRSQDGTFVRETPVPHSNIELSARFWDVMAASLVNVIEAGTAATSARIPDFLWAGKTGSAQNAHGPMAHGWFVGYAPAQNPRIAISVIVENAGHGGVVAAPIAKEIVSRYIFGNLSLTPDVQSTVRPLANESAPSEEEESPSAE